MALADALRTCTSDPNPENGTKLIFRDPGVR